MKRNERGITLIALVITIIVLLILAGITISTLTTNNGILKKAQEAEYLHKLESDFEKIEISIESKLMDSILEDRTVDLEELGNHLENDEAITKDWFIASNEPVEEIENVTEENDYRVGSVSKNKPSGQYLEVISFDYKFTFWIDGKGKIYYDKNQQPEDETKEEDGYLFDTPGIFKMTINAGKPAQWVSLIKFGEYVPEGAQISYEFQTSNDRINWSEKTDDIKDLERSQYARVIVNMTANSKGESPKIRGLSMKFVTEEEIQETEDSTIIKLKNPIKIRDLTITVPIDITQEGTTNTYEIKITPKEDGTYEIDSSSLPNELHITPNIRISNDGTNWETINSGNIDNTYQYISLTYDNLTIPNVSFSVKTPSISSKTVHIQTAQKIPEWLTVSDLDLYADATAIGEWLSIEPDEYLPSNTRLVYKFSKSNNFQNWTSWSDSITENGKSQYLWIKVYSQIEFRTVQERARLNDILINYKLNNQIYQNKGNKEINYKITYKANGAPGEEKTQTVTPNNKTITLPENPYTYTAMRLLGWCENKEGTGTIYKPGSQYTIPNRDCELYAIWVYEKSSVFGAMQATGMSMEAAGFSVVTWGNTEESDRSFSIGWMGGGHHTDHQSYTAIFRMTWGKFTKLRPNTISFTSRQVGNGSAWSKTTMKIVYTDGTNHSVSTPTHTNSGDLDYTQQLTVQNKDISYIDFIVEGNDTDFYHAASWISNINFVY